MKLPKVSVIIPNYNHARYLEKRIRSVLEQTYQDFEVIYLDDASTDDSAAVFARFQDDPRIRAVLNEHNSGTPFIQWNRGVREARGEYVWLAEADDFAHPRFLETLVGMIEAHPQVGMVYCRSQMVDRNDHGLGLLPNDFSRPTPQACPDEIVFAGAQEELIALRNWDVPPWDASFIAAGRDFYRHFMIYGNEVPNASAVLFRKAVYEAAGGAHAEMRLCGDYLTWIGLLKVADVIYTAQPLNYFRMHASSVRSTSNKTGAGALERYQVAHTILSDLDLEAKEIDHLCHLRMLNWLEDLLSPTRRVPWSRFRETFALARRTDPRFWPRGIKQIFFLLTHRLPIVGALSSARQAILQRF